MELEGDVPPGVLRQSIVVTDSFVSCGQQHGAAIINDGLFTWGKTLDGRLGHGNIIEVLVAALPLFTFLTCCTCCRRRSVRPCTVSRHCTCCPSKCTALLAALVGRQITKEEGGGGEEEENRSGWEKEKESESEREGGGGGEEKKKKKKKREKRKKKRKEGGGGGVGGERERDRKTERQREFQLNVPYSSASCCGPSPPWSSSVCFLNAIGSTFDCPLRQGRVHVGRQRFRPGWLINVTLVLVCMPTSIFSFPPFFRVQLGHGDRSKRTRPMPVAEFADHDIASVAAGGNHCLVLTGDCHVWSWGVR